MFTVFRDTGEFVCIDHGTEAQVLASLTEGMLYVPGAYPSNEYSFDTGKPVKIDLPDDTMQQVRTRRNSLLAGSDWTQLPDSPLTDEQKQAWAVYRQALRDVTENDPVVWPDPPVI